MGWFEEQIATRKKYDDDIYGESFLKIANAVLGKEMLTSIEDEMLRTRDAISRILSYHRVKMTEVPDNIKNVNEQLEYLLRPHGIMRREVVLSKGWYKDAYGAMLGMRKDTGEVVALIPNKTSGYHFLDSVTGNEMRVNSKNEDWFAQEAIAFYVPFPLEKMTIGSLAGYILRLISTTDLVIVALMMLGAVGIGMILPILNKWLFSAVILSETAKPLVAVAVFMVSSTLALMLINMVKSLGLTRINIKLRNSVEAATMMRLLSLPADFFKQYSAGDLQQRSSYLTAICDTIVNSIMTSGIAGIFSLLYIGQIFAFAASLVVPSLVTILTVTVISVVAALIRIKIAKKRMLEESKESGLAYSLISGIQKIKLAGAEKRAFAKWGDQYSKRASLTYDPPLFLKTNTVICTAINLAGVMWIYYAAVTTHVAVSDFYAFNTSYGMVSSAISILAGIALSVAELKPMFEMCAPIVEELPEVAEQKQVVDRLSGSIEMNHVSFRYTDSSPMVINNLSLKISPGEYVAIVGTTGCGKSTLMRLLLGFEKPVSGAVLYDGKDLGSIDLRSLRRKIGTVMQNGRLFQGDIFSNITISAPWLTMDDAWEAAEKSGIADDIRHMPMGMFTIISEGQGGISGGQRQRLMIARAIAPKPRILMFDEATSALDNVTQKMVSDALAEMKCTRIVIAHRLSTIRQCDRILVLDKGQIIQQGTYDELINQEGFFAELVERQRVDI